MAQEPINQVLNRVTQQLKPASDAYKTQAGQTNERPKASNDQLDAINQIFELFRFNYHNQFLKAYPDLETINMAKRLWLRLLADYSGAAIMRAAEKSVRESSFLPNVHEVLSRCDSAETLGLPSAHAAYVEACRATTPKREFSWSHPAIYFAGRATDWFFIANEPEQVVFPVFKRNYELLIKRVEAGEELHVEVEKALPQESSVPLSAEEQKRRMAQLKQSL